MTENRKANRGSVLLVSNYSSDVGYAWWLMEHFWTLLAHHFEKQGSKAFLAYPSITELPPTIRDSNIQPIEMTIPGTTPLERQKIGQFIRQNNVKAIYFTDRPWFSPAYAYLRFIGVRTIVVHDHTPGDRPPVGGIKGFVKAVRHRLPMVNADRQFCVSPLMRRRSIQNGRIPASKCLVVQNGIPPVDPPSRPPEDIRHGLNIRPESVLCITTGRAHPYKRFDFIINVAADIQSNHPDEHIFFLIAGDGPALEDLKVQVQHLGLEGKVILTGFRPDARELLAAADLAMHAALGEGFSLSIVEYMSSGLPVLVPDIPSVKQAVDHEKNGMVYKKDDIQQAAQFVVKLAREPEFRKQLSQNARIKANTLYTLDVCTEAFQKACDTVFPSGKHSE